MSRREDIDNSVWSDPDFAELTPQAKLIYLWSFTNPRCGMAGVYKVSRGAMHLECTLPPGEIDDALAELAEQRFCFYDGRVMWIRTRVKHMRSRSPSIARSIVSDITKIGLDHPYVEGFIAENVSQKWLQIEGLPTPATPPVVPRDTPGRPPADPQGTPSTTPRHPQETPQGKGKGKPLPLEEEEEREHGQPTATTAAPPVAGLHPDHGEVVAILEAARAKRPGLVVDEASVNSALMAHRSADAVSAAHEVVSQLSDGTARTDIASTVLRWVLRGQGEQRSGGGQHKGGPRRGETPDVVSGRGSSSALTRAMQRDREQAEARRRHAEQEEIAPWAGG